MAPINKDLPLEDSKVSIGYSRGRDSQRADTSFSTLFSGLTEAAGIGVGLADQIIQAEIRRDITDKVDTIRGGFTDPNVTVSQATGLPDGTTPKNTPLPDELKEAQGKLKTLKTALDQKKISETSYYSQVLAESRRIRQRWPGYREQIDNITKDVVGVDPANAIVRKVFSDANQRESRAYQQAVRDENLLRQLSANGKAPDWAIKRARSGEWDMPTLMNHVAEQEHKIHFANNVLPASDNLTARKVHTKFQIEAAEVEANVLKQFGAEKSSDLGTLLFNAARNGSRVDPQQEQALQAAAMAIINGQRALVNKYRLDFKTLPPGSFKAIEDILDKREQVYSKAINSKEGLVGITALDALYSSSVDAKALRDLKANSTAEQRMFWIAADKYPQGIKEVMSLFPAAVKSMQAGTKPAMDAVAKTLVNKDPLSRSLKTLETEMDIEDVPVKDRPAFKNSVINGVIRSIPESPEDAVETVDAIMPRNERAFKGYSRDSWQTVYNNYVSPSNIAKLAPSFQADPALAKRWAEGVRKHWSVLYKQELDNIQQIAGSDPNFRLNVEEDGTLTIQSFTDTTFEDSSITPEITTAQGAIDNLNKTFLQTQNALQATGLKTEDGKGLHFALVDQVLKLSDGRVANDLENAKNVYTLSPEFDEKLNRFLGDLGEGLARELPLTRDPIVTENPPGDDPNYPEVSNFGGGRTSGLAPEGGDPESTAALPDSAIPELILSLFPGAGEAISAKDAVSSFRKGDYLDAGIAALGAAPVAGLTLRFARKGMGLFEAKATAERIAKGIAAEKALPEFADDIKKAVDRYANEVDNFVAGKEPSLEVKSAIAVSESRVDLAIEQAEKRLGRKVVPFEDGASVKRSTQNTKKGTGEVASLQAKRSENKAAELKAKEKAAADTAAVRQKEIDAQLVELEEQYRTYEKTNPPLAKEIADKMRTLMAESDSLTPN